jgi:hypothetical protein
MNENENNFDALRQLLKLKRHEIPPPRYFNEFSGNVIAGIRAEKSQDRLSAEAPWLAKFLSLIGAKPGMLGGMATSVCLLFLLGVVLDRPDAAPQNFLSSPTDISTTSPLASVSTSPLLAAADNTGIVASTNPITSLQPVASLFGQPNSASIFQPASFSSGQ